MSNKNLSARMFLVCAALAFWGCARYDDVVIPLGQGNGGAYAGGGSGPVIQTNIVITGGYLSAGISEPPVRVFFTDGGAADGYIDTKTGIVMLYDDQWNDGKSGGKTFHTLRIISSGSDILLSREFYTNPATDPVELVINDQGGLEFHPYIPNPNDGYKGYIPISTVGELALIGRDVGTQCGAYRLTRDLDLLGSPVSVSGNVLTPRPHNWVPIELAGAFDGEGRRLENLYINRQADTHQGLFGIVSGTVKNTRVSGSVAGYRFIGGVAGEVGNGGRIEGCSFDGAVVGYSRAGGVVGENYGTITACYNTGAVTAADRSTGGVAGCNWGTITASFNSGEVEGNWYIGGVAGWNYGAIIACSNTGNVMANWHPGGVVSQNYGGGTITACYNTGAVTAAIQAAAGVAAVNDGGTITACYNVGPVCDLGGYAGGMAFRHINSGIIQACFWIPGGNAAVPINFDSGIFTSVQQFSSGGWPRGDLDTELLWQIHNADGSGPGYYWKSMGNPSDNPGPTDFPRLWWEP